MLRVQTATSRVALLFKFSEGISENRCSTGGCSLFQSPPKIPYVTKRANDVDHQF